MIYCECLLRPTEWLWRDIPVLFCTGELTESSNLYLVDEKANRVCAYLRAFENGTINRKFESYRSRRLLVVNDCIFQFLYLSF
jgi:hypothetical protein